jgi:hypothetical protein
MRRTTTHTSLRPDGLLANLHMVARGRDLWTGADGVAEVVADAALDATIAYIQNRTLLSIAVEPDDPALTRTLEGLEGVKIPGGFRRAMEEGLPGEDRTASLRYQLLDELPSATLVSGNAIAAGGLIPARGALDLSRQADICAGWATGGSILVEAEETGHIPMVTGPVAPALETDDPLGWHALGPMPPHTMRRWRRIDVWRPEAAGPLAVEAFFRDSHVDPEGLETVVHEYLVSADIEPGSYRFLSCRAELGVLPWAECPGALASASRVEGTTPHDLRARVRETYVGTSTCTHLNDTLRALAALPHLAGWVEART